MCFFKKAVHLIFSLAFITGSPVLLFGANNSTMNSAQWLMYGGARASETEDADTPIFNPAGTALMDEGFHVHLSVAKVNDNTDYTNQKSDAKYKRTTDSWLYPLTAVTYNADKWAGFFTLTIPGTSGGGEFDSNGHAIHDAAAMQASFNAGTLVVANNRSYEYYGALVALTFGGSYRITDAISLAYGLRQLTAISEAKSHADLVIAASNTKISEVVVDQSREGSGIGHRIGLNVAFSKKLNFGMHYDTEVPLKIKTTVASTDNTGTADGEESDDNLAAKLQMGLQWEINKDLELATTLEYFIKKGIKTSPGTEYSEKYDNSSALAVSLAYKGLESLELAVALRASSGGIPDDARTFMYMNDRTTYQFIGLGGIYNLTSDSKIVVSYGKYLWKAGYTPNDPLGNFKVQQDTSMIGLGFETKL